MLEEKLVTEINQALRKSIARQRELVHKMDTLEVIDSVKNLLSATIASMNDLRKKNALIDYDVIKAFRILVGDIRNFNEYKGKEVVHVPGEVDAILASGTTSIGIRGLDDHNSTHGGAGGAYHGHYQELGGGDPHHALHLKVAGVSPDGGCCCSVM